MRIYHNSDLKELEGQFEVNENVDLCNITKISHDLELGNIYAPTWRWVIYTANICRFKKVAYSLYD